MEEVKITTILLACSNNLETASSSLLPITGFVSVFWQTVTDYSSGSLDSPVVQQ